MLHVLRIPLIRRGLIALAAAFVLGLSGAGRAGPAADVTAATAAFDKGDFAAALALLRPLADQGDAAAQYNLAQMYRYGKGVPQDLPEAVRWYQKAALQGDRFAQFNLGVMYDEGRGVQKNIDDAIAWYRKAAEQGDARALYNLGVIYENGQGVMPNAEQAYVWYSLAAFRFQGGDPQTRARVLQSRDRVAAKMTPDQLASAQQRARDWKPN